MRRVASAMALLAVGLAAAGCGDDEKAGTTPARTTSAATTPTATTPAATTPAKTSPGDEAAVRRTMTAWGRADTPAKACALMSERVRQGLLRSDADACRDKKKFQAALGVVLKPTDLKTTKVRVTGETAVADTEEPGAKKGDPPQKQRYNLVKEGGSWKVDSIDQPRLQAPPAESTPTEPPPST